MRGNKASKKNGKKGRRRRETKGDTEKTAEMKTGEKGDDRGRR